MFRFRLAQVLRLRLSERDTRRAELAQALAAERAVRDQAEQLQHEILEVRRATVAACQPGVLNVDRLLNTHRFELVLQMQLDQLNKRISQIHAEVQRRQQRLVEADREVRVLEQLRDKQAAEAAKQMLRVEQREMDEIALRRYREQHQFE